MEHLTFSGGHVSGKSSEQGVSDLRPSFSQLSLAVTWRKGIQEKEEKKT